MPGGESLKKHLKKKRRSLRSGLPKPDGGFFYFRLLSGFFDKKTKKRSFL